mgnify:CR=1 FL=1
MEGELLFYINHEKYPLHAGELLIVNANEIHSVHALKTNKTAVIQIPLRQFEGYFTAQQFIRFEGGVRGGKDSGNPSDRRLISLVQRLYNVYAESGMDTIFARFLCIMSFFICWLLSIG